MSDNTPTTSQQGARPYLLISVLFLALAAGALALLSALERPPDWLGTLGGYLPGYKAAVEEQAGTTPPPLPLPEANAPQTQLPHIVQLPRVDDRKVGEPKEPEAPPLTTADAPPAAANATWAETAEKAGEIRLPGGGALFGEPKGEDAAPGASAEAGDGAEKKAPDAAAATGEQPAGKTPAAGKDGTEPENGRSPVIIYGKGKAVTPEGSVVRGAIVHSEGGAAPAPALPPARRDSVMGPGFIDDLALFLADNYWPEGTHPLARSGGVSTAGLRWANTRYGMLLHGFHVDHGRLRQERARVLRYVFMPSMLNGLYSLYAERFFTALEDQALARRDGQQGFAFTNAQVADMFAAYAGMAAGLAGCVDAYQSGPEAKQLAREYAESDELAHAAYRRFSNSMQSETAIIQAYARQYQDAIMRRELKRTALASTLRRNGDTRGLDEDSLVYAAMWLHRRGQHKEAAVSALAGICRTASTRLIDLEQKYRQRPSRAPAGQTFP